METANLQQRQILYRQQILSYEVRSRTGTETGGTKAGDAVAGDSIAGDSIAGDSKAGGAVAAGTETGKLPAVMLVHGFTEDRRIWQAMLPGLSGSFRFIFPDLPGSGSSPANSALNSLEDFAAALNAIIQAENLGPVILIGHSMGGYISLAFAQRFPDLVAGLGLFHSTARPDSPEKKTAREKNQDFIRRNGAAVFVRQSLPGLYSAGFRDQNPAEMEEQIRRYANFDPEMLVLYLEAMKNRPDRTAILESATVPVLFILGEEDKVVPPAEVLAQGHLPRISYFHTLAGTAHMGMVENPNLCISCVNHFLDQFTW